MAAQEQAPRPRRSVLFVPAANPGALRKAAGLDCDGVILDLEDSVAPEAKDGARLAAVEAVRQGFGGQETAVRCNGLETAWGAEDLGVLAQAAPDAVLVPKIRSAKDIRACDEMLKSAPGCVQLWAMIETAQGVLNLAEIVAEAQNGRLSALVFGPNDLAAELRLKPAFQRDALRSVLTQLALAARASGLAALGGAFTALDDDAGFEAECREEAGFGLDGKTLVHPRQIEPANRVFSPSADEIAWAQTVVAAFAAPEAAGRGVIRLQGRMLEHLHLRDAERVLRLAQR